MASRWLSAAAWTSRASTASHGLTRGSLALGIGSQGSSRSPQDPTRSNCFGRRRIWCPRRLLQVLGFDSRRGKSRRHGRLFIGENPSTRSERGDDIGSISNWKQITSDRNEFGKGMNSVDYEFVANSALELLGSGTLG
jgi:hypothetical protein